MPSTRQAMRAQVSIQWPRAYTTLRAGIRSFYHQKMKRILVADDSLATRALVAAALADLKDIQVERVATGIDAIKLLSTSEIDLVLTDIHMPEINGLELVRFIKSDQRLRSIPVIIISTEAAEDDRRRALSLGADDYLPKPFTAQQLQHTIKKHLGVVNRES